MAPYIGITGFMARDEVESILEVVPSGRRHKLMVGVLASSKTISGLGNKWPGRYPPMPVISRIFIDDPRTVNLIHYATDDMKTLPDQTAQLVRCVGPHHQGYQLNMKWPEPGIVSDAVHLGHRIVLQIGSRALEEVGHDPKDLSEVLDAYNGLISDILIDPSGGNGKPFDPVLASELLLAIQKRHPQLGLGVAGGLSAQNLRLVEPLVRLFPNLSIDAEGKLRNPSDDSLNVVAARQYVSKAFELFAP